MAKIGRNEPCPCGSGKKYKNCCLQQQEAAARALAAAAVRPTIDVEIAKSLGLFDSEEDELTTASNAAVDLVHEGKLDEAEQIARDLLERFPDVHDGWDRLGMVYEARGDNRQAADCYRKIIEFIRTHPDDYEPGFEAIFHKLVNRLDPSAPS
jgi:tetratricopeptide (TPR) repeat protein